MAIRKNTPCDFDGICPYDAMYNNDCEYWCGADEPEDTPEIWEEEDEVEWDEEEPEDYEDDVDETGYNPYLGCYDYDC